MDLATAFAFPLVKLIGEFGCKCHLGISVHLSGDHMDSIIEEILD